MPKKILIYALLALALISVHAYAELTPAAQARCIAEPYDWTYDGSDMSIAIKKVTEGDVTFFVADVQLTSVKQFRTELDPKLSTVSELAGRANAILAINGDDYATHEYGVIIRNGELLRTHDTTRNMLLVDANGDMSVRVDRKGEDYAALGSQLIGAGARQSFEFGPALVANGQALEFSSAFDVISTNPSRLEPRTAIGQIGPLHYVIMVVDGRQEGYSAGMTLPDLRKRRLGYGAQTALNLDGGGSTELWFQGQILNRPAGGKERAVSDIICF